MFICSCSGTQPGNLGVTDGRLAACPASPNCVSSQASKSDAKQHFIAPLYYEGTGEQAKERLIALLPEVKCRVVANREGYLQGECTSEWLHFVDDLEFSFDDRTKVIDMRSASRLGYSDLGVNRKRMEEIRTRFNQPAGQAASEPARE